VIVSLPIDSPKSSLPWAPPLPSQRRCKSFAGLRGASRQTSVAAPSPAPSALGEKRGKSKPVVPAPTVTKPTVSKPWAWTTGRYRRQPPPKLVVRGLALTSHRLASGAARHRGIWFLSSRSTGHGFGSWRGRPDGCISGVAQLPAEEARRVCHRMPRPGPGLRNPRRFLYDGCPGIRAGGTGAVKRSAGIENPPFFVSVVCCLALNRGRCLRLAGLSAQREGPQRDHIDVGTCL